MTGMSPEERLEISPNEFKRLDACTALEIESALRLIARKRIDLAWASEQAAGGRADGRVIARRFFAAATERERDLFAYWQAVQVVERERLSPEQEDDQPAP